MKKRNNKRVTGLCRTESNSSVIKLEMSMEDDFLTPGLFFSGSTVHSLSLSLFWWSIFLSSCLKNLGKKRSQQMEAGEAKGHQQRKMNGLYILPGCQMQRTKYSSGIKYASFLLLIIFCLHNCTTFAAGSLTWQQIQGSIGDYVLAPIWLPLFILETLSFNLESERGNGDLLAPEIETVLWFVIQSPRITVFEESIVISVRDGFVSWVA